MSDVPACYKGVNEQMENITRKHKHKHTYSKQLQTTTKKLTFRHSYIHICTAETGKLPSSLCACVIIHDKCVINVQ